LRRACQQRGLKDFLLYWDGKIIKQSVEDPDKREVCGEWDPKMIFDYLGLEVSGEVIFTAGQSFFSRVPSHWQGSSAETN
jgi:hypothetical protein